MIEELLDRASRVSDAADVVRKTDDTVSLRFEGTRLMEVHGAQEAGINLRVVTGGRHGSAGSTVPDAEGLIDNAAAAAALGEQTPLHFPAPAPLPILATADQDTAEAGLDDLETVGGLVAELVVERAADLSVTVERSLGSVTVANSRGVHAGYDATGLTVAVAASPAAAPGSRAVQASWSGVAFPGEALLEELAETVNERLAWGERSAVAVPGETTALLGPGALHVLLGPVRQALRGRALAAGRSPWSGALLRARCDSSFSLWDDPSLEGRSGSRPIDDEGVVCRRVSLVERGVVRGGIYDLETAGLAGVPATGHARRSTFGKPQAAYSNLVVAPGPHDRDALLDLVGNGVWIDRLTAGGVRAGGTFRAPVLLGYRVERGAVAGMLGPVRVTGNVFRLLERIRAVGSDTTWIGSMCLPAVVVGGVTLEP